MKKENKKEYWSCDSCKINSNTRNRMIPCPRGSCEAEIVGEIITTKELKLFNKKDKKNKNSLKLEINHECPNEVLKIDDVNIEEVSEKIIIKLIKKAIQNKDTKYDVLKIIFHDIEGEVIASTSGECMDCRSWKFPYLKVIE